MSSAMRHALGSLLALIASVVAFKLGETAELCVLVALGVTRDELDGPPADPAAWLVAVLAGSLALVAIPVLAALSSPAGAPARLRLSRPRVPATAVPALAIGTLAFWALGAALVRAAAPWLSGRRAGLIDFAHDLGAAPLGWRVLLVVVQSAVTGAGEEILFRGFLQGRLLERWRPGAAIAVTTLVSALAGGTPSRFLLALPAAAWLGFLAVRTGSILPGILGHAALTGATLLAQLTGLLESHAGASSSLALALVAVLGASALIAARRLGLLSPLTSAAPDRSRTASTTASRSRTGDA